MIVGLDMSLSAFGLCAIPDDWSPNQWGRLVARTVVTKPGGSPADRLLHLAKCVTSFCASVGAEHVFCEDYPPRIVNNGRTVRQLAELGGAVKTEVRRSFGIEVVPVNVSAARKLLLGSVPQASALAKVVVFESLRSIGAKLDDDAQTDAFCVANWGRSELGLWAVIAA